MRPDYGAGLVQFIGEPDTITTRQRIHDRVTDAVGRWEPRIELDRVDVLDDPARPGQLRVHLAYRLRRTGEARTLGLNLQLLTPEYGPRVILTAVLCSVDVECDKPMAEALCKGPTCGRCLKTCPGDAVLEWGRDWDACDKHRSPHGFAQLTEHLDKIIHEGDAKKRKDLLRSEDSFNLWQSILRGAGVVTGCRRCADVCPVGADYAMLADALEEIPENTPEKERRLAAMKGEVPSGQKRFIGFLKVL